MDTALEEVKKVQPSDVADLNKKEGMLYDLTEKIADMCTITEEDVASGMAATKNEICSYVPKIALGYYYGEEVNDGEADHADDMSDIGCTDLPLVGDERYFIFGIALPEIPGLFSGGNLCYAQWMNGSSIGSGTGMILFAPQLFTGNPIVKNINAPVPGTGEAIDSAAGLIEYVAVGISFPSSGPPKMEVELSTDFWRCSGECKVIKANVYAAVKLDVTEAAAKKIKLGEDPTFSFAFEAKLMFNFDPEGDGFDVPLVDKLIHGDGDKSGSQSLVDPTKVLDFLLSVMSNDFIIAIDGKLTMSMPLSDWSNGLFGDLDITIGTASAMFRNARVCEDNLVGSVVALHNQIHNRWVRMHADKNEMDASSSASATYLPSGWTWERFKVVNAGNGQVAFHNSVQNRYIRLRNDTKDMDRSGSAGDNALPSGWTWERFTVVDGGNGEYAFHNSISNRFMRMNNNADMDTWGENAVNNLPTGHTWERFKIVDAGTLQVKNPCNFQIGIWASFEVGGTSNEELMDDIQTNILDKFQDDNVLSAVGFLGKGIGAVVDALTSVGAGFHFYMKGNCNFNGGWDAPCSNTAFGLKFWASKFEAYIEKNPDGRFAFCFAIKDFWDSCGNNLWENILLLLKSAGEVLMKVGKIIADFFEDTFNSCVTAVVDLAEDALALGKIVIDYVHEGFEDAVSATVDWANDAANAAVEWGAGAVNDAGEWVEGAANDVADWTEGAANDVANAAEDTWNAVSSFR